MAEFDILPIFTDAYLADTRHLTAAQHGAYFLLLMMAWRSKTNSLPDDDEKLAAWAAMNRRSWANAKPVVMAFWKKVNGEWRQERLDDERKRAAFIRDRQVQGGLYSALKRKNTNGRHLPREHIANHQPPSPSPSPSIESVSKDTDSPPTPHHKNDSEMEEAVRMFNLTAEKIKIPKVQKLSDTRRKHLKARLRDCAGLEGWKVALAKLEAIPAMRGVGSGDWKADFDFLVTESRFIKLMEGGYDSWGSKQSASDRNKQGLQEWVDS